MVASSVVTNIFQRRIYLEIRFGVDLLIFFLLKVVHFHTLFKIVMFSSETGL